MSGSEAMKLGYEATGYGGKSAAADSGIEAAAVGEKAAAKEKEEKEKPAADAAKAEEAKPVAAPQPKKASIERKEDDGYAYNTEKKDLNKIPKGAEIKGGSNEGGEWTVGMPEK